MATITEFLAPMADASVSIVVRVAATTLVPLALCAAHAEGRGEQQRTCMQDAVELCSGEIPDVPRITACMTRNIKKLSPDCRAQFDATPVAGRRADR